LTGIHVGIDASNIRAGGGITHLSQTLSAAEPERSGVERVVVWAGKRTLGALPERGWLEKVHVPLLDRPLPLRLLWQQALLPGCLQKSGCDVLFSPGGTIPSRLSLPSVVMSQNLLPFEAKERARFGIFSFSRLKMMLLRRAQAHSMRRADGLIFLTRYARDTVLRLLRYPQKMTAIIPHGVEKRFSLEPRTALPLTKFSFSNPFRILYVSIVDVHKHQWHVVRAVGLLRRRRLPVEIDLIGPAYPPALRRLQRAIREVDPRGEFVRYRGPVRFQELHAEYGWADAFVFASSCENLPNILLEAMAAGLPIACSRMGPMPEVLKDAGVYFDPEQPVEIARALQTLVERDDLRTRLAHEAQDLASTYSWERCAEETFSCIADCVERAHV
jgi:glycosyltransferase involved in cell wall biosynthesis